jgi:Peptidase family M23
LNAAFHDGRLANINGSRSVVNSCTGRQEVCVVCNAGMPSYLIQEWVTKVAKSSSIARSRIVSIYGHLSQIPPDLREGADVQVGQIIGRVGSSGLSTGPHLHYGLEKDGSYVNPLTATIGPNHQVSPHMRALFDRFKSEYLAVFKRLPLAANRRSIRRTLPSIFDTPEPGVMAIAENRQIRDSLRSTKRAEAMLVETGAETAEIEGRRSVMR